MFSSPEVTKRVPVRGLWFLTLFSAEGIPATMVTYVALLLLLQLGTAPAEAISLSAMLFLPWVTKPLLRYGVRGTGHFRGQLHVAEALLSASLLLMALAVKQGSAAVFLCLCGTSLLCVWHELVAGMCYEKSYCHTFVI